MLVSCCSDAAYQPKLIQVSPVKHTVICAHRLELDILKCTCAWQSAEKAVQQAVTHVSLKCNETLNQNIFNTGCFRKCVRRSCRCIKVDMCALFVEVLCSQWHAL